MADKKLDQIQKLNGNQKLILVVLALIAVGILITFIPFDKETISDQVAQVQQPKVEEKGTYEEALEKRLENILENLDGAGITKVMITTNSSDEKVLAEEVMQNSLDVDETTLNGGKKRSEKEDVERKIVKDKSDTPFIIKENKPKIEGVLVLAEGADDTNIKNAIIQSVSSLLNVPVHKIAVYKMVNQQ